MSNEKKTDKDEKVKMLKSKVSEMDSAIKLLVKQINENNEKAESISAYMKEETELRNTNHAEIEATLKDAQDAQAAIAEAVEVLTEFYKKSGMIPKEPWEFIQVAQTPELA